MGGKGRKSVEVEEMEISISYVVDRHPLSLSLGEPGKEGFLWAASRGRMQILTDPNELDRPRTNSASRPEQSFPGFFQTRDDKTKVDTYMYVLRTVLTHAKIMVLL